MVLSPYQGYCFGQKMKTKGKVNPNYSFWLIPILSLLVVFQTIVLFSQARRTSSSSTPSGYIPLAKIEESKQSALKLSFVPAGLSLVRGEVTNVDLVLTPKRILKLDGINLYLNFNPEILEISQVTVPKLFSSVSEDKKDLLPGQLHLTFLEEKVGGLLLDKEVKLLTLSIKGKAVGEGIVSISTAEDQPSTVLTESGTSKKILFDKGTVKLVVY